MFRKSISRFMNRAYYIFNEIISIKGLDLDNIKTAEMSHKNLLTLSSTRQTISSKNLM